MTCWNVKKNIISSIAAEDIHFNNFRIFLTFRIFLVYRHSHNEPQMINNYQFINFGASKNYKFATLFSLIRARFQILFYFSFLQRRKQHDTIKWAMKCRIKTETSNRETSAPAINDPDNDHDLQCKYYHQTINMFYIHSSKNTVSHTERKHHTSILGFWPIRHLHRSMDIMAGRYNSIITVILNFFSH